MFQILLIFMAVLIIQMTVKHFFLKKKNRTFLKFFKKNTKFIDEIFLAWRDPGLTSDEKKRKKRLVADLLHHKCPVACREPEGAGAT